MTLRSAWPVDLKIAWAQQPVILDFLPPRRLRFHPMARQSSRSWKTLPLDTMTLCLDAENPRIDAQEGAGQEAIRALLLENEGVLELAQSIVEADGLLAGERIIVVEDDEQHVVLEGNRRVCACQLLLDPSLAPLSVRKRVPGASDSLKASLARMSCDIAPSRDAAEITITKRHTSPGVKQWSPVAKQRRIARLIAAGKNIEQIAEGFSMKAADVRKLAREHNLLVRARGLRCWSPSERKKLSDPRLQTNPFTRFFTLGGARGTLQMSFDDQGNVSSTLEPDLFDQAIERLARELLLRPDDSLGTRATAAQVFRKVFGGHGKLSALIEGKKADSRDSSAGNASARVKVKAKAARFFETLVCNLGDDQLLRLTEEIRTIDYKQFKTAATFLIRALVENTLWWCIREKKLHSLLMKEYQEQNGGHKGKPEPGLEFVLKFCINHRGQMFAGNVKPVLDRWMQYKPVCDLVIHGKWLQASEPMLVDVASHTRPFITQVFDKTALA